MRPRPTLRIFCRWMLTILTVVLVVVWIGSGWYIFTLTRAVKQAPYTVDIHVFMGGGRCTTYVPDGQIDSSGGLHVMSNFARRTNFELTLWPWHWDNRATLKLMTFPLWLPLFLFAIPTALMWRTHIITRRRSTGMCKKCGYDITGLVGKEACPECGTGFEGAQSQASAS